MNKKQNANTQLSGFFIYREDQNISMKIELTVQEVLDIITVCLCANMNEDTPADKPISPAKPSNIKRTQAARKKAAPRYLRRIK